eukprot:979772_1
MIRSLSHVCEQMGFAPMGQTGYYSQHQAFKNPLMQDFCKCFDDNSVKQRISDTVLFTQYVRDDDEEKAINDDPNEMDEVDVNECFVTFSSEQNATNHWVDEDFTSLWSAKLQYKSKILATERFWFVELNRLAATGSYM